MGNVYESCGCDGNHLERRDFLRVGSLSFLGMGLSQFLRLQQAYGAIDSVTKAKAKSCPGIQISELLPRCAKMMDKLSIIRSMHSPENNHHKAQQYALTGHLPNPAMEFPALGSIIAKEMGPRSVLPAYTMVSGLDNRQEGHFKSAFLGAENDPMIISGSTIHPPTMIPEEDLKVTDLSLPKSLCTDRIENREYFADMVDQHYRERLELAEFQSMDTFSKQALAMILSPQVREAFNLDDESEKMKDAYGRYAFGQSMLLARRLIEAGSRFVTAAGYRTQSWDAHSENDQLMTLYLGPTLDQSLATLLEDLDQRGLLESTLVIVMGEFGRTADKNPYHGRDHWPECWSMALAGGGIRGGQVIGASDERGAYVAERKTSVGDLYATIYKAMGIDWHKEYMHPIGRPIKIANAFGDETGTPIPELI